MPKRNSIPNAQANLALILVEKFALIAAVPDGYDEAGRQKMRLMEPAEAVARSCQISEMMFLALDAKGWLTDETPSVNQAQVLE